jgi:hypothetical protein
MYNRRQEMTAVPVSEADIKRLKAEKKRQMEAIERDLEALERVEAMLNGQSTPVTKTHVRAASDSSPRTRLRDLVLEIVWKAPNPLFPQEIVKLAIEKGYPFASARNGLGSVTSVLSRKKGKGVHKLPDGRWVGERIT